MKRLRKIFAAAAVTFILMLFLQKALGVFLKKALVNELNKQIITSADVESLSVNLPKGIVTFTGLKVKNPAVYRGAYVLEIKKGRIGLDVESLFKKPVRIKEVILIEPALDMEVSPDGILNTGAVFKKKAPRTDRYAGALAGQRPRAQFGVDRIIVEKGFFKFTNFKVNPRGAAFLFDDINIAVENLRPAAGSIMLPTSVTCGARLAAGELPVRI
ncbi:MAG: hypothetical protein HY589_05660, partial [Candidatus Omnitrophica bacterium]|nr:hypothetical protein [Candidatus Omnitrophota bacterium]